MRARSPLCQGRDFRGWRSDQVFAGYRRYRWHTLVECRRVLPARLRHGAIASLARAYPKLDWAPRWLGLSTRSPNSASTALLVSIVTIARVHHDRRRGLCSSRLNAALDGYDPSARVPALMEESGSDDPLAQAQYVDVNLWLVGDILTKVDRASMANSLEVRAPILDYNLSMGASLPASLKLKGRRGNTS